MSVRLESMGFATPVLERTQHVKVWMSFAQFELNLAASQQEDPSLPVATARSVFQRANR